MQIYADMRYAHKVSTWDHLKTKSSCTSFVYILSASFVFRMCRYSFHVDSSSVFFESGGTKSCWVSLDFFDDAILT